MPSLLVEHRLGRRAAGQQQQPRPHQRDRPLEEGRAGQLFVGGRRAVAGRSPEDGVGDEDAVGEPGRGQHAVEELPARPTNGAPARSSSAPGASPMIITGASGAPREQHRLARALVFSAQPSKAAIAAAKAVEIVGRPARVPGRATPGSPTPGRLV